MDNTQIFTNILHQEIVRRFFIDSILILLSLAFIICDIVKLKMYKSKKKPTTVQKSKQIDKPISVKGNKPEKSKSIRSSALSIVFFTLTRRREPKNKPVTLMCAILIPLLLIPMCFQIPPLIRDATNKQFECAVGSYNSGIYGTEGYLETASIQITVNGEVIPLKVPKGKSQAFPKGKGSGTFWYSKESLILLMIETDDGIIYLAQ